MDLRALLERAVEAARAGAALAVQRRGAGIGDVATKSTQTDVVTPVSLTLENCAFAPLEK